MSASSALNGSSSSSTAGLRDQRAGQRHPLRHAAGELARQRAGEAGRGPTRPQRLGDPLPALGARQVGRRPKATLPATVSQGISRGSWNTMPTLGAGRGSARPSRRTRPLVGVSRPATMRSSVLLPQPLPPTMATISPVPPSGRRRRRASVPLAKRLETLSMVSIGSSPARRRCPARPAAAAGPGPAPCRSACPAPRTWRWRRGSAPA